MSESSEQFWSNNPNAPQIPLVVHLVERGTLVGLFFTTILYGVVVALFFRCMYALLSPVNRTQEGIRRGLVVHTVAMFALFTIPCMIEVHLKRTAFIDNRDCPGTDQYPYPGPSAYGVILNSEPITIAYVVMFPLNQWLADGLLLYRCYLIYSMNYMAMVLPCLLYLSSIAMGILHAAEFVVPTFSYANLLAFDTSYFSISLSLNALLALMIIARLTLHSRNVRKAIGASNNDLGSYTTTITTMLVESYALYALSLLLFIVPWDLDNWVGSIFAKFPGPCQVIAPYLIIIRVADRRALTGAMITGSEHVGSMQFISEGTIDDDGFFPDEDPTMMAEASSSAPNEKESSDGAENVIEEVLR